MAGKGTVGNLLVQMRADLGQLRMDVKDMEGIFKSSFTNIQTQAVNFGRNLASSLGIGLSIGGVVAFANQVIQLGSRLKDLSVQTGFSVQTLSGLKSVLEENGSSLEGFATGIFRLQKELGTIKNDADPTAQAIKALGLNLKELQNADTDKFLELVTNALAKQENPITRNALAFQFMGRQARELVPALLEMAGKLDEFKRQGLTDADVKILDDFADGWTRVSNQVKLFAASEISGVLREFTKDLQAMSALVDRLGLTSMPAFLESFTSLTSGIKNTELELLRLYEAILKIIRVAPLILEGLSFGKLNFNSKMWTDMITQLQDWQTELRSPSSHTPVETGTRAPFVPPVDTEGAKKVADAIKRANEQVANFIDGLKSQNRALELSQMELGHTAEEIKKFELEEEKAQFIAKVLRDSLVKTIPPELLRQIDEWNAKILENTKNIAELKRWIEEVQAISKAWVKDIDDLITAEEKWAEIKMDPTSLGMDDLSKELDEISRKYIKLVVDAEAAARAAGALPEEIETVTRRILIDRALAEVRARAAFTPDVDPDEEGRKRAEQLGASVGDSITSGIRNTLMGIETGQQSVGEGLKNMLRNIGLELQFLAFDETILKPMKAFAEGFIGGLFGAIGDEAEKEAKRLGEDIGNAIRNALSQEGVGQWVTKGLGMLGSLFGMGAGAAGGMGSAGGTWGSMPIAPGALEFAMGGRVPSFAGGGLFIGHGGEFVMQKTAVDALGGGVMDRINKTGKLPSGGSNVSVNIQGDIIPRAPNMTKDDVIKIMVADADNLGPHFQVSNRRRSG